MPQPKDPSLTVDIATLTNLLTRKQLLELAVEGLRARQGMVPSDPAPKTRTGKYPTDPDAAEWKKIERTCPRCGDTKKVVPGFGVKVIRGELVQPQSWCKDCRSKTNYHHRPRGRSGS